MVLHINMTQPYTQWQIVLEETSVYSLDSWCIKLPQAIETVCQNMRNVKCHWGLYGISVVKLQLNWITVSDQMPEQISEAHIINARLSSLFTPFPPCLSCIITFISAFFAIIWHNAHAAMPTTFIPCDSNTNHVQKSSINTILRIFDCMWHRFTASSIPLLFFFVLKRIIKSSV